MQCPKCKQWLDEKVRFCPHDGTPLIETTRAEETPTGDRKAPSRDLELPVVVGERYRLDELRGGGGMAKVYRAFDLHLERVVAIKLINPDLRNDPEFDARFQREARIVSQLNDPHIIVVHDFGLDPNLGPYLVMEYLQGQSLRERLVSEGRLPLKAALQLAGQLVLALIHAHDKNVVHRDIKPDNIFLLNQSGVRLHVRVLDFGIARIYGRNDTHHESITQVGSVLGTPRYMSPEQLAGKTVDARSDLYSAALVLFESLTGQLPYVQGKRLCELCPEASPALQALVEQCLSADPNQRPPSAVEVYLRLQELGKASGILLLPPGTLDQLAKNRKAGEPTVPYIPSSSRRLHRRSLLLGGLAAVGGLVAGLAGWWYWAEPDVPGPETLHGLRLGDSRERIEELQLRHAGHGNPWDPNKDSGKIGLSPALKPTFLFDDPRQLQALDLYYSANRQLLVFLHEERIVAIQSRQPRDATNRHVRIGSEAGRITRKYGDDGTVTSENLPQGSKALVYTYAPLGLAFETSAGNVSAIVLFPPRSS